MSASQFAIVIASETKAIRRAIYPDDDKQIQQIAVLKGEEMLVFQIGGATNLDDWKALVEKATGVYPPDPVCAVVDDTGKVENLIMADPALDNIPQGKLVACSADIKIGDTITAEIAVLK